MDRFMASMPLTKDRIKTYLRSRFTTVNERPIIVLGNQKSGTSAIAHLLADFGGLTKTIDIPLLWGFEGLKIMKGEIAFDRLVDRYRIYFAAGLIKEPAMTFFADKVVHRFPEAAYLFVVRDPRSNIRSWLDRHSLPGDLAELGQRHLSSIQPASYTAAFDREVWGGKNDNYVGVLARRWNRAAEAYFDFQYRMRLVRFEDFLADKHRCIVKLASDLGIPERKDISNQLDVQYQPRGNRAVNWETFFGPENLARIERTCGAFMSKLGYEETRSPTASSR